jgi:hypothetical protein
MICKLEKYGGFFGGRHLRKQADFSAIGSLPGCSRENSGPGLFLQKKCFLGLPLLNG